MLKLVTTGIVRERVIMAGVHQRMGALYNLFVSRFKPGRLCGRRVLYPLGAVDEVDKAAIK